MWAPGKEIALRSHRSNRQTALAQPAPSNETLARPLIRNAALSGACMDRGDGTFVHSAATHIVPSYAIQSVVATCTGLLQSSFNLRSGPVYSRPVFNASLDTGGVLIHVRARRRIVSRSLGFRACCAPCESTNHTETAPKSVRSTSAMAPIVIAPSLRTCPQR